MVGDEQGIFLCDDLGHRANDTLFTGQEVGEDSRLLVVFGRDDLDVDGLGAFWYGVDEGKTGKIK